MKKKKHRKRKLWPVIVSVLAALAVLAAVVVFLFRTRTYEVEGNSYYGENTITSWIQNDRFSVNSLYVLFKYNFTDADLPSAVESMDISLKNPWTVHVKVTEKEMTGYVDYDGAYLYFDENGRPLDTARVEAYLSALSGADLSAYATYNASAGELEAMGMNDPELTVTVDYTGGDDGETAGSCTVSIARAPGDRATPDTAAPDDESADDEAEDITAYLRVGESQIIYELPGGDFTDLMAAGYDDLRHQELFWGDWDDVTAVDVTLEGETHALTAKGTGEDRVWSLNGTQADMTDVTAALNVLTAERFTGDPAAGQEELALTLHLDNENFPTVTIRLTRLDGEYCLAEVDGASVCLVSRADTMTLVEAVQAIVLGQSTDEA